MGDGSQSGLSNPPGQRYNLFAPEIFPALALAGQSFDVCFPAIFLTICTDESGFTLTPRHTALHQDVN